MRRNKIYKNSLWLLGLASFLVTSMTAQVEENLKDTWISPNAEMLIFRGQDSKENILAKAGGYAEELGVQLKKDTLIFNRTYQVNKKDGLYVFKIISLDSLLTIKPVSTASSKFFDTDDVLFFKRKKDLKKSDLRFENLKFSYPSSSGMRKYYFEVTSDGKVKFRKDFYDYTKDDHGRTVINSEGNRKKELVRSEKFYGKMEAEMFNRLLGELSAAKIEKLDLNVEIGCPGCTTKTLKVEYNGSESHFTYQIPPQILKELNAFLMCLEEEIGFR